MELSLMWTIALRELREALRNKWLAFYAVGFAALAFALSQASLASAGYSGLGGFGRTAASLINALLLFVPLLGLSVGAGALAGDRERGTLMYLLAQPVNRAEVFFGKALGSGLAVTAAMAVGFGLAALALASAGDGDALTYVALAGYTALLALASLGLGFVVSARVELLGRRVGGGLPRRRDRSGGFGGIIVGCPGVGLRRDRRRRFACARPVYAERDRLGAGGDRDCRYGRDRGAGG